MTRLLAATLVVAIAFSLAAAQPAADKTGIVLSQDDSGEWVWTLPEKDTVSVSDLLGLYARCRQVTIMVDPRKLSGDVGFQTPEATKLTGSQIDMFVANGLADFRLCLMNAGENQYKVIPAAEAVTMAPILTESELETAPDWEWASLKYKPEYAEANALRGALQNFTTRQGGVVNPIAGANMLLICERADRLRELVNVCNEIDENMKPDIRAHALPEGVSMEKAMRGIIDLLAASNRYRQNQPTFTRSENDDKIVVRGPAALHDEVDAALNAMK